MENKNYVYTSEYFYGNKISEYGLKHNRVDYATLANAFNLVLNNNVFEMTQKIGEWEIINGSMVYYEDNDGNRYTEEEYEELAEEKQETCKEFYESVYQWYIISDSGARLLQELTDEIVMYNEELDMNLWGVRHFGTSWDYVLTNIKVKINN